ncbi:MAG: DNA-processing protein DprA [Gammaproteobacteria bacterium]|nr:DNA-processing protein DprA [Gammaproteobacteria bacterium]
MPVTDDVMSYWLALNRASQVGPITHRLLMEHFSSPEEVFAASASELSSLGLKKQQVESLQTPDWDGVEKDLAWLGEEQSHICLLGDENYPALLKQIPDPPTVLFIRGNPKILELQQIAIVGSRNPTPMGKETAYEFARHLASLGLVVTSGLALGIDAAAHQGALSAGGMTIAVVGTGPDRVYPARHRDLAHQIVENGALISEFPIGVPPAAGNFPRRNRIISGMGRGVLVVEAALRSGSLITARQALEQNREVFAVPGSIHNPLAKGCNALIRQGAKLVETAEDILEEIPDFSVDRARTESVVENSDSDHFALDLDYQKVLENVGYEPTTVDTVVERSGLTVDAVCSMLLVLELQGYISLTAGGQYCLAH